MNSRKFLFSIILLLLLSLGCALIASCATAAAPKLPYAFLTDQAKYTLLPPDAIEKPMDMAQFVSASYRGQKFYSNAWVQADVSGIEFSLFSELGASIGDLSYRNGNVSFSSSVFPKSLKPEYIVADFQLCFYEPHLLERALKDCGLALETVGANRRILSGKKLIVEIEKTPGAVKLVNHLRGYTYTLEGDFGGI